MNETQVREALISLMEATVTDRALDCARLLLRALPKEGAPLDQTHPELASDILVRLKDLDRNICTPELVGELYRIEGRVTDLHSLYQERNKDFHYVLGRVRRDELIRKIKALDPSRRETLLDLGCADGTYLIPLMPEFSKIVGVDISEERLKRIPRAPHVALHSIDLNSGAVPAHDESASVVLATEILEHVQNVEHLFEEIARCLKPGGLLFASFPNRRSIVRRLEAFRSGGEVSHSTWYHPHDWSISDFGKALESHGLRIVDQGPIGIYVPKFYRMLGKYGLQRAISRLSWLAPLGEDVIVTCRRN